MVYKKLKHVLSVLLTIAVVLMLLIVGPANAVQLSLEISDSTPTIGNQVTFTGNIDVETSERVNGNITVDIINSQNVVLESCTFSISGNKGNCSANFGNVTATVQSNQDYGYGYSFGYGYGYGYGYFNNGTNELSYSIPWTANVAQDSYSAKISFEGEEKNVDFSVISSSGSGRSTLSNEKRNLVEDFEDLLGENIDSVREVSQSRYELVPTQEMLDAIPQDLITPQFKEYIDNLKVTPKKITFKYIVYEIEDSNGKIKLYTKLQFENNEKLILVIPKNVIKNTDLIKGDFKILIADPVIEISSSTDELLISGDISKLLSKINAYSVEPSVKLSNNPQVEEIPQIETPQVENIIPQVNTPINEQKEQIQELTTPVAGKFTMNTPTIIGSVLGLLLIIGLVIFFIKRRKD